MSLASERAIEARRVRQMEALSTSRLPPGLREKARLSGQCSPSTCSLSGKHEAGSPVERETAPGGSVDNPSIACEWSSRM